MTPQQGWTIVLWAGIAAIVATASVAGFLWLSYKDPAKETPWEVEILPGPTPAAAEMPPEPNRECAWLDRERDIVRIPIEEAMILAADRLTGDASDVSSKDRSSSRK